MTFKVKVKSLYKKATSPEAKKKYAKFKRDAIKAGAAANRYFANANRGLDSVVGTRDPNRGKLAGVALKRKRKIQYL